MSSKYEEVQRQARERQEELRALSHSLFAEQSAITLEIGCGHGHFLTAYAIAHPEDTCVGIDLINRRIEKGNSKKSKRNLENLFFIKADVNEFLDSLPESLQLKKTFMLFPDPWPKKRHFKNRMVQTAFLDKLHALAQDDGHFCFRTDHAGYFEWTQEHLENHSKWKITPDVEWPFEEESFFQNMMDSWQSLIAKRLP